MAAARHTIVSYLPNRVTNRLTTACYVCVEIKARVNERARADLWTRWVYGPRHGATHELGELTECERCNRPVCVFHIMDAWYWRQVTTLLHTLHIRETVQICLECRALHGALSGASQTNGRACDSFRRRWRLYRWRATKRRLVDRLRISRVVVSVLPNDLAQLVATYAVQ